MYIVTINYPVNDSLENKKQIFLKKKESQYELTRDEIINIYDQHISAGYDISLKYITPETSNDPFEIAKQLTEAGIDYKASLKVKNKLNYEQVNKLSNTFSTEGFDYDVAAKLKVNDTSYINISKPDTWTMDGVFTITPKVNVTDINEIKSLYDKLNDTYTVEITIKPKSNGKIATEIDAYPEGTEIVMTLKEAEVYE